VKTPAARAVSIVGHPLLVLPLVVLVLPAARAGELRSMLPSALGCAAMAALLMGYSWWQVRQERWAHVDASGREERRSLTRFLLLLLGGGAAVCTWVVPRPQLALGLGLGAAMVLAAKLTARYCKLSLHVACAAYAACLLLPTGWWAMAAGLAGAAAVAWSRLVLSRHTPRDVAAGAIAGVAAGLANLWLSG
jgi:hypothetical protein